MELDGVITLDGRDIKWVRNPVIGGLNIFFDNVSFWIHGDTNENPDIERIRCAIIGYRSGYERGKQVGRSILQNEFRNLMDCQPLRG